jgi:hypothetical protein
MTTHSTQVFTIFGGGYVSEQRADEVLWNLGRPDVHQVVNSLTVSMVDEVMKSLRSALSLK